MARISTYAAAQKYDRAGHVSLTCGFVRRVERRHLFEPRFALKRWQEFQLVRPQVEILATIAEFNRYGFKGSALKEEAQSESRRTGACRSGRSPAPSARAPLARCNREKRHLRADGQVCPSALLAMVRPPADTPYETSTNRPAGESNAHHTCKSRQAAGAPRPAAIGAGFVRLASGRARARPADAYGRTRRRDGACRPALGRRDRRHDAFFRIWWQEFQLMRQPENMTALVIFL